MKQGHVKDNLRLCGRRDVPHFSCPQTKNNKEHKGPSIIANAQHLKAAHFDAWGTAPVADYVPMILTVLLDFGLLG